MFEYPSKFHDLAEAAWQSIIEDTDNSDFEGGFSFDEVARFEQAFYKLIVEECCGLFEGNALVTAAITGTIRQHFGVQNEKG